MSACGAGVSGGRADFRSCGWGQPGHVGRLGCLSGGRGGFVSGSGRLGAGGLLPAEVDVAYGFVVEPAGRVGQSGGHGGAGEGSVDEEGTLVPALDAPVLLLVVEDQPVAQAAGRLCEVLGDLVGVGAVGGQQPGREAERDEPGQGVDRVRADALARGVQDEAERELRVAADAFAGLRVVGGLSPAGRDQKGRGVPEDPFLGASAVVPARGEFDGGEATSFAGRAVPGRKRGGVGADVVLPVLEQSPAVSEADGDQDETVADLLTGKVDMDEELTRLLKGE